MLLQKMMKKSLLLLSILVSLGLHQAKAQGWKPLFNKKDFTGWHTIPGGKWEVVKGVLVGTSERSDPRHGLLVTDQSYKDFTVSVTYKAIRGNSGLYFRVEETPDQLAGVRGFQAEIDPNKDAGGLYETQGRAWVIQPTPEQVKTWYKPNKWNKMTVEARGGNIIVKVNGKETARLNNDTGRTEGKIALQLHGGHDMYVMFKEVKLKPL